MIYILNNVLQFNSKSGEVSRLHSDMEIIKLTPILNYILTILIENNHVITPREKLIEQIFDSYEINVSINTLNQYISILRKLLQQQTGIDNAILNISKKGIVLSSEIIIKMNDDFVNDIIPIKKNNDDIIKLNVKNVGEYKSKSIVLKILIIFSLIYLGYLSFSLVKINSPYKKINSFKINNDSNCSIYSFQKTSSETPMLIINEYMKEFNLTCDDNDDFYYYTNILNSGKNKQRLLVKCEKNKTCISTRVNWQDNHE